MHDSILSSRFISHSIPPPSPLLPKKNSPDRDRSTFDPSATNSLLLSLLPFSPSSCSLQIDDKTRIVTRSWFQAYTMLSYSWFEGCTKRVHIPAREFRYTGFPVPRWSDGSVSPSDWDPDVRWIYPPTVEASPVLRVSFFSTTLSSTLATLSPSPPSLALSLPPSLPLSLLPLPPISLSRSLARSLSLFLHLFLHLFLLSRSPSPSLFLARFLSHPFTLSLGSSLVSPSVPRFSLRRYLRRLHHRFFHPFFSPLFLPAVLLRVTPPPRATTTTDYTLSPPPPPSPPSASWSSPPAESTCTLTPPPKQSGSAVHQWSAAVSPPRSSLPTRAQPLVFFASGLLSYRILRLAGATVACTSVSKIKLHVPCFVVIAIILYGHSN